ncbi:MAG: AAA family ATPase [Acidimicrobiia bacterium]
MLVGRRAELELLHDLVAATRHGRGSVLVVAGEPGIGKSALLAACVEEARSQGLFVLDAQCDELGRARPFGPLLDAVGRAGLVIAETAGGPGPSGVAPARSSPFETGPEERARLLDAVTTAVEARCAQCPVALAVDDLHWADGATLLALGALARRSFDLPLLVVLAHRPTSHPQDLESLVDSVRRAEQRGLVSATWLELMALEPEAATTLGERIAGGPLGPALADLVARCDGNPLLVAELVGSLRAAGALTATSGCVEALPDGGSGPLPARFRDTVRSRMANLDRESRTIAAIAAVLGSQFSLPELAAATRRTARDLVPVVEGLIDERLLLDTGHALRFRHDLVRNAIADSIPPTLRTELHRSIGASLGAAGAPLSRVAEHVALGAAPGSQDAVAVLRRAASEIGPQDPSGAVRLLRRALEICAPTGADRDHLLAEVVDALAWSGRIHEARETATAVLARPVAPVVEQGLRAALGRALLLLGRPHDAVSHEERLVELHEALGESTAWPLALCAVCRLFAMDLDGALTAAERAIELGRRDGEPMAEILGLCVEVFGRNGLGESVAALDAATRAVTLADRMPGGAGHRLHPHLFRAIALLTLGKHDAAAAAVARGRLLGEAMGATWALPIYHFVTALAHWDRGLWDDLLAEVEAGVELGEEQQSLIAQVWAFAVVGRVRLFRDDLEGAASALDRADALRADAGPQVGLDWLAHSRALLLEAQGRRSEGLELLRAAWETARSLQASASLILFGPDLARLAIDAGEDDLAAGVRTALDGISARSPHNRLATARAAFVRGITERDAQVVVDAAGFIGEIGYRFEAAQARAHAAALLALAGNVDEAVVLFESAIECFEAVTAVREADRARAELTALRRGPGGSRRPRRAATGWDALTAAELAVVERVCAGYSNPEVARCLGISRRTVEAHLRSVFMKLVVRTRLELVVAAHEREKELAER